MSDSTREAATMASARGLFWSVGAVATLAAALSGCGGKTSSVDAGPADSGPLALDSAGEGKQARDDAGPADSGADAAPADTHEAGATEAGADARDSRATDAAAT